MFGVDFGFKFLAEIGGDVGADGGNEEKEADGVGKEAGGDEDGSCNDDDEAIECFLGGKFSFCGGLVEPSNSAASLCFSECSSDSGGDDNDDEGVK